MLDLLSMAGTSMAPVIPISSAQGKRTTTKELESLKGDVVQKPSSPEIKEQILKELNKQPPSAAGISKQQITNEVLALFKNPQQLKTMIRGMIVDNPKILLQNLNIMLGSKALEVITKAIDKKGNEAKSPIGKILKDSGLDTKFKAIHKELKAEGVKDFGFTLVERFINESTKPDREKFADLIFNLIFNANDKSSLSDQNIKDYVHALTEKQLNQFAESEQQIANAA